jgi:2,3-bisphosphoglycerate-independent phosphoglycerate mutase
MVLGTILNGLDKFDDYRIMVASDHYTPLSTKTHSMDPSLFAMADKAELQGRAAEKSFNEKETIASGISYNEGYLLLKDFLGVTGC